MIVINAKANVKHIGDIQLNPGSNVVDDAKWKAAKAMHPKVAIWLKPTMTFPKGELIEVGAVATKDMDERTAIETVFATVDLALLENWKRTEKRQPVLDAIGEVEKKAAEFRKATAELRARKAKGE